MDMVHFDVLIEQDTDPIIVVEHLKLKENKVLKGGIQRERLIGWLKVKSSHSQLLEKIIQFLLSFLTTWLVEVGFSAPNDVLTMKLFIED